MAELYVLLILKGVRTYKQVPGVLKSKVKDLLIVADLEHLIEE